MPRNTVIKTRIFNNSKFKTPKNGQQKRKTPKAPRPAKAFVSIAATTTARRVPNIRSTNGATIISHKEFIADISSTGANFAVSSYAVNPGIVRSFPWLSTIAQNYESYLFKNLVFHYKPICPTSTAGVTMVAVDYDAQDAAPVSKVAINCFAETVSTSVWSPINHNCLKQNLKKFGVQRYIRTGTQPTSTDVKTYDVGNLFVATSNTPTTAATLGEIWVSYTVHLFTPQMNTVALGRSGKSTQLEGMPCQGAVFTSVQGTVSMAAEYLNDPIFAITKQWFSVTAGTTIFDIAFNPYLYGKTILLNMKSLTELTATNIFRIGKPPNVVNTVTGPLITANKAPPASATLWDWSLPTTPATIYARQLFTTVTSAAGTGTLSDYIPQLRFEMPFTGQFRLMAAILASPSMPEIATYTMASISNLISLMADPTPWNLLTNNQFVGTDGIGAFSQTATQIENERNCKAYLMETRPMEPDVVRAIVQDKIEQVSNEFEQLTLEDTYPSPSIAQNIRTNSRASINGTNF